LELVGLDRDVLLAVRLGRVPGSVRTEEINPEQERRRPRPTPLEPLDRLFDSAHRASILVAGGAERRAIAQKLFPARLPAIAVRIVLWGQAKAWLLVEPNLARPGIARRNQRVIPLTPHPENIVKTAPIADAGFA